MHRLLATLALAIFLPACPFGPDTSYTVDGVTVYLENGKGPEQPEMIGALREYRTAAVEAFGLSEEDESRVWNRLVQIRWTPDKLKGNYEYKEVTRELKLRWLGCVLDSPLYMGLTEHYAGQLFDEPPLAGEHDAWPVLLSQEVAEELCP